jgi:hypothetical protein
VSFGGLSLFAGAAGTRVRFWQCAQAMRCWGPGLQLCVQICGCRQLQSLQCLLADTAQQQGCSLWQGFSTTRGQTCDAGCKQCDKRRQLQQALQQAQRMTNYEAGKLQGLKVQQS